MERVREEPTGEPFFRDVPRERWAELEGPFECSRCRAQVMIEASWLAVREGVFCPICGVAITKFCDATATNIYGYRIKSKKDETPLQKWIEGTDNGIEIELKEQDPEAGLDDEQGRKEDFPG